MASSSFITTSIADLKPIQKANSPTRAYWVDIAKGISISLVVFWHVASVKFAVNEALVYLRMPLFFFVAGLFARALFARGNEALFLHKVLHFIYLFVVWSAVLTLLVHLPRSVFKDDSVLIPLASLLKIFINPPQTLWFIYALAVAFSIAMITRKMPILVVLSISLFLYFWSVSNGNWSDPLFYDRVIRLFPFFYIGIFSFALCDSILYRFKDLWVFAFPLFLVLSYSVYHSSFSSNGLVTFLTSCFGLFSALTFARSINSNVVGAVFKWVGMCSLFIYVLHRIVQFYAINLLEVIGLTDDGNMLYQIVFTLLLSAFIVYSSAVFGSWLTKSEKTAWLFTYPSKKKPLVL